MTELLDQTMILPAGATPDRRWRPALLLQEQRGRATDRRRPVLYVHGATFPAANSIFFRFDGISWADALNQAGFPVWCFDFAGYGGSERYPEMAAPSPPPGEPLGRAPEAACQIERAVRAILEQTGAGRVSIIAHSWGTIASGLFATRCPDLVDRLAFFGPIARRQSGEKVAPLGPWRFLTVAEQHQRFVEDVPPGHPPVLSERHFARWADVYLGSDPTGGRRSPPAVRTPNGPIADILAAWSGALAYDPAAVRAPVAILRGEWDSLCTDEDAAWLRAALGRAPEVRDVKLRQGTHLMHLEEGRGALHQAAIDFLLAK